VKDGQRADAVFHRSEVYRRLHDTARADHDLCIIADQDLPVAADARVLVSERFNQVAWDYLAQSADPRVHQTALKLARTAVLMMPQDWLMLNTLGVAYYRAGSYKRAIATLERSVDGSAGQGLSFNLIFLAMAHARAGDLDKARRCYDQAIRWADEHTNEIRAFPNWWEELMRFRAEADNVLVRAKKTPTPKQRGS
jgi:tetratricopeptide (TPR) repeat protein